MTKQYDGYIDRPVSKLRGRHFPKKWGLNIEPAEKFLESAPATRPIGLALEKEFGKRISAKEWEHKVGGYTIRTEGVIYGVGKELLRLNKRINKIHQEQIKKHLK